MLSADAESRRFRTLAEARILPVRSTTFPGMTSVHLLEPAVPIFFLMYTGRHLHNDSGRVRITRAFPVVQELQFVAIAMINIK